MPSFVGRVALVVTMAGGCGCGSSPATPGDLPGPETSQLLAALQQDGSTAEVAEIMPLESMPFFSVRAVRLLVDGSSVHVLEYATESAADAEAALVSADGGTIGLAQVLWVSTPHFFRGSRLIVLYVGTDDSVIEALTDLLGPQFAGR